MERTKINRKPDAILTSDWHLREDTPTCFTGDWYKEQWESVYFVNRLQNKHDCIVLHAGDLFDHWKPSPALITQTLQHLPNRFYTIYGQHDLPQHNWELRYKTGLRTIEEAGRLKVLKYTHWGQKPGLALEFSSIIGVKILVWHHLTYLKKPFPGASGGMARGILKKYPQFDLIVTGDNHTSFTTVYEGRRLVNPGNLTRQTADQIDFKPNVWLWYADTNDVERVYLPIQKGVISREHIERKQKHDKRIDAFISKLDNDWNAELSFKDNLEIFKKENKVEKAIMEIIYESLER